MTTSGTPVHVKFEAQGSLPNWRYDVLQPLFMGRVQLDGITIEKTGPTDAAGYNDNPKFQNGDFALLDNNWGDLIPAIENGWDFKMLPLFIKRKPAYNYGWVRADRGINSLKDVEGKVVATVGYSSAITTYTRGFLQHFHGVDISKLKYLLGGPGRFDIHAPGVDIQMATGPRKTPAQRLLDGEADISMGDITDPKTWVALESDPNVKRLFSNYQELNLKLWKEHQLYTPVHVLCIGGKFDRANPGVARKIYDAVVQSTELASQDLLGDGTSYSPIIGTRELYRDQLANWGNIHAHGIKANANTINMFLDYNHEQGVTKNRLSVDQVFAAGTLDT